MAVKLNWATRITIFRVLMIVPFVSFMLKTNDPSLSQTTRYLMRYVSVVVFLLMAVSDGVDGYLARKKNQITRLGTFLDPVADKLLMTSACLLLASSAGHVGRFLLPPTVVVFIIGKDLFLLIGFVIVYLITSRIHIAPVFVGKLATALQRIWFLRVLWWSAAATALLATLVYIRDGSRYIEAYEQGLTNKVGNGTVRETDEGGK
ncbi:MAG: CDP-alcohol phosphatidyltransferase family protein [Sedimentisphaerales bacterium]